MTPVGAVGVSHARSVSETIPKERALVVVKPAEPAADSGPSAFARMVHGLGREINGGEAMMRSATQSASGSLDPGQLIALQAGVYRYSEAIDLASKLVDHASGSVKTVIQGSGQ